MWMSRHKPITILKFDGPRFADHGLDVDVLGEIIAYKRLLQETAKELWRRKHPARQRLPKNFDMDISLKFFTLEPGSTEVPLERSSVAAGTPRLPFEDELDDAAILLENSIRSAGESGALPKDLPRNVVPLFQDFGKTLRPDECMIIFSGKRSLGARYDDRAKKQIMSWASVTYRDAIDLTGEVRGTDLDGLKFTLRLANGRKVPGRFEPEQEAAVLEALGDHASRRLRVIGEGDFSPEDGNLQQIAAVDRVELIEPESPAPHLSPIWERLALIGAGVPDNAWNDVPTDLAASVDEYLYGKKAKDQR
jgi:hypothetical protein